MSEHQQRRRRAPHCTAMLAFLLSEPRWPWTVHAITGSELL
jgi:hypothetical protein